MKVKTRLCVDCKYYCKGLSTHCTYKVENPHWKKINLVSGQPMEILLDNCYDMRYGDIHRAGDCGIEGKFWEQK